MIDLVGVRFELNQFSVAFMLAGWMSRHKTFVVGTAASVVVAFSVKALVNVKDTKINKVLMKMITIMNNNLSPQHSPYCKALQKTLLQIQ